MELVLQVAAGIVLGGISLLWVLANWERVKDTAVLIGVGLATIVAVVTVVSWLDT